MPVAFLNPPPQKIDTKKEFTNSLPRPWELAQVYGLKRDSTGCPERRASRLTTETLSEMTPQLRFRHFEGLEYTNITAFFTVPLAKMPTFAAGYRSADNVCNSKGQRYATTPRNSTSRDSLASRLRGEDPFPYFCYSRRTDGAIGQDFPGAVRRGLRQLATERVGSLVRRMMPYHLPALAGLPKHVRHQLNLEQAVSRKDMQWQKNLER